MRITKGKPYCTPEMWMQAAAEGAAAAGLRPSSVLAGNRLPAYVKVRWTVWQRLVAEGYSYWSIGQSSGFDHTTIINACNPKVRARGINAAQARRNLVAQA